MALEPGGRADKFGNLYEDRFVVRKLVDLLCEEAVSVTVEPVGPDESGVDLIVRYNDAPTEFLQCKARNGNSNNITMSWLSNTEILTHIAAHTTKADSRYVLVTPLAGSRFQDLLKRAANSPDCGHFYQYQLSAELKKDFHSLLKAWALGQDEYGIQTAYTRLVRTRVELIPDDWGFVSQTKALIGCLVTGDPEDVYNHLNAFPRKEYYGKAITAPLVWDYLKAYDHFPNQLAKDRRLAPRIQQLNQEFCQDFFPVNDTLLEPPEAAKIMEAIREQRNVLVLGKAGSGKSGCLQALLKKLESENIAYLAIKLNRYLPVLPTQQWGQRLSLPASPTYCFKSILGNQPGVLVLDQLDSLRWTANHVEQALLACKMLLAEVESINRGRDNKIVVALVSRTFDYQTDPTLKSLVGKDWKVIEMTPWAESAVENVLGEENYRKLLPKTVELLKTPNNLAIWQNLEDGSKYIPLRSPYDLIQQWMIQIYKKARENKFAASELRSALADYLKYQTLHGVIPEIAVADTQDIAQFLVSENVLREMPHAFCFSHQSIADYLSVARLIKKVLDDVPVGELVPEPNGQVPQTRIVWQMFWQQLLETNQNVFLHTGQSFLALSNVHFYFKCTFWEALGQISDPSDEAMRLLKTYWTLAEWKPFLLDTVFRGHPSFIKNFIQYGFGTSWEQSPALDLLLEIAPLQESFAIDILESIALQSEDVDKKISGYLYDFLGSSSDRWFALGMKILRKYPQMGPPYLSLHSLTKLSPKREILFLEYILEHNDLAASDHFLLEEKANEIIPPSVQDKIDLVEAILPLIMEKTPLEKEDDWAYRFWRSEHHTPSLGNHLVRLLAEVLSQLSFADKPYIIVFLKAHWIPKSFVEQMLVLQRLQDLSPAEDAAFVYDWLAANFPQGLFESTSTEKSTLGCAQRLLKRFSPYWTAAAFSHIERLIMEYHDPNELERAQNRFVWMKPYGVNYFPYWGMLQEVLLPCLDESKLSMQAKQQIAVLQRRAQIVSGAAHFANIPMRSMATFTSSKLSKNLDRIQDKTWLRILSDKSRSECKNPCRHHSAEASPTLFAQSFGQAIRKEPERFAAILERLPTDIFNIYVCYIFYALRDDEVFSRIGFSQICSIVEKFSALNPKELENNRASAFCDLIEAHAKENWPPDILQKLCSLALHHPHPAPTETPVQTLGHSKQSSVDLLQENAINCVRGSAFAALGQIAWEHPEHCCEIISCFEAGKQDPNPAVRYALANNMGALYNYDQKRTCKIFHDLLVQDFRVLAALHHEIYIPNSFQTYEEDIRLALHSAFVGEDSELQEIAGLMFCGLCIYNECSFPELCFKKYTESQASGICDQALYCMQSEAYFPLGLNVLRSVIPHCEKIPFTFIRAVFLNDEKKAPRTELLDVAFEGPLDFRFINEALESFLTWDLHPNICYPYIAKICQHMVSSHYNGFRHEKELLPKILLKLLDFADIDADVIQKCLDLWDDLFRTNVISAPLLLRQINED